MGPVPAAGGGGADCLLWAHRVRRHRAIERATLKGVGLTAELDVLAFGRATRTGPTHALAALYIAAWPPSMLAAALRVQLNAAAFLLWRSPRPLGNRSASTARPARASPSSS